jgi:hypothetical protein
LIIIIIIIMAIMTLTGLCRLKYFFTVHTLIAERWAYGRYVQYLQYIYIIYSSTIACSIRITIIIRFFVDNTQVSYKYSRIF